MHKLTNRLISVFLIILMLSGSLVISNVSASGEGEYFVESGITIIESYAFSGSSYESVYLPGTVETISENAFTGSDIVNIYATSQVKSIGNNALNGKNVICIPGSYIWNYCEANAIAHQSAYNIFTMTTSYSYSNNTYALYDGSYDWIKAKYVCEILGGHLATITSEAENNAVLNLESVAATSADESVSHVTYWVGASDSETEGQWKWVTGEAFDYGSTFYKKPWMNSAQPDSGGSNPKEEDGLAIRKYKSSITSDGWNDSDITAQRGFICEFERAFRAVDSVEYNGHLYLLYDETYTWTGANDICTRMGGHLATITSKEENEIVKNLINGHLKGNYWIGLTDEETEGQYKWVTGENFEYSSWATGEPNGGTKQQYVSICSCESGTGKVLGDWCDQLNTNEDKTDGTPVTTFWRTSNFGFILEIDSLEMAPIKSGYIGDHCYEIYQQSVTGSVAEKIADIKGGYLAAITTKTELDAIKNIIGEQDNNEIYWLSGGRNPYNLDPNTCWSWEDEENSIEWSASDPSYSPKEDFLRLYLDGLADASGLAGTAYSSYFIVEYNYHNETVNFIDSKDNSIIDTQIVKGNSFVAKDQIPEKTGYLIKWYKDATKTQEVNPAEVLIVGTTDFYGDCTNNKHTLYYDAQGGEFTAVTTKDDWVPKKTVYYDKAYGNLLKVKKDGYQFDGWFDEPVGGNKIDSTTICKIDSDHTAYAHWTGIEYVVSFNPNGGDLETYSKTVAYSEVYGNLPVPQKEGYTFVGWFLNDGAAIDENTHVSVSSDHIAYARYTQDNETVVSAEFVLNDNSKVYHAGDNFDVSDVSLVLTYADSHTETITEGIICNDTVIKSDGIISLSYGEYTSDIRLNVEIPIDGKELVAVEISTMPSKLTYKIGETIDTSDMVLKLTFENREQKYITSGYDCSVSTFSKAGKQRVTVTYKGFSASFYVTVLQKELSSISINTLPYKTEYTVNETFNSDGLTISCNYNDGTSVVVNNGFTVECDTSSVGTKTAVISYTENGVTKTTEFEVTVTDKSSDSVVGGTILSQNVTAYANHKDETVTIPVCIEGNSGVMGYMITMTYDTEVLKPIEVISGAISENGMLEDNLEIADGKLLINWYGTENSNGNGELFAVKFNVIATSERESTVNIGYVKRNTFNENGQSLDLDCSNASSIISIVNDNHTCVGEIINKVEPTCETAGYTGDKYCSICGSLIFTGSVVPALGHTTITIKENEVPATDDTNGYYDAVVYCSVCDKEISRKTVIIYNYSNSVKSLVVSENIAVKGEYVTWTIKTSTNVNYLKLTGSYTIDGMKKSITIMYKDKSTSSNVSVVDDGNIRTWIIKQKTSYTGEADSVNENFVLYYKVDDDTTFIAYNKEGPVLVTVYASADKLPIETVKYDPYTLVSVAGPETIKVGVRSDVTIVTTDDCTKVRIGCMTDTGAINYTTYQTTTANNVAYTDANGLRTWTISYKFVTNASDYSINARGTAWGEAKTFKV